MSLLKWKELAKRKTELGNKINYVHNAIKQHKIGEETSQESFGKLFKPVTSKLDDVIDSNLNSRMLQRRKLPTKKGEVPDYGIDIDDEVYPYEDMDVEGLINFGDYVPPQQEKQIGPIPTIHVDPPDEPPEYDYSENIDYGIPDEEMALEILKDSGLDDYEAMDEEIDNPGMTFEKKMKYLDDNIEHAQKEKQKLNGSRLAAQNRYKKNKNEAQFHERMKGIENARHTLDEYINIIKEQKKELKLKKSIKGIKHEGKGIKSRGIIKKAEKERNKIKGYKSKVTKDYNKGVISAADRQIKNKRLDDAKVALNQYISHYKTEMAKIKGSRIKSRGRKRRGGDVVFFDDPKQLLKKLELIVGELIAGNTNIQMRNMGVNILDTLLRMSTINRPQYNKIYNNYLKI